MDSRILIGMMNTRTILLFHHFKFSAKGVLPPLPSTPALSSSVVNCNSHQDLSTKLEFLNLDYFFVNSRFIHLAVSYIIHSKLLNRIFKPSSELM